MQILNDLNVGPAIADSGSGRRGNGAYGRVRPGAGWRVGAGARIAGSAGARAYRCISPCTARRVGVTWGIAGGVGRRAGPGEGESGGANGRRRAGWCEGLSGGAGRRLAGSRSAELAIGTAALRVIEQA